MDALLREEIERLCARHGLGAAARRDVESFVEMLLDPRLQLTAAPGPAAEDPAAPARDAYEDLGLIGAGGMGEVRRVREGALGRIVAMKVLRDEAHRAWFEREARLTASLDHPGVLPLYAFGARPDGRLFFTLREASGRTLREVLDEPEGRRVRPLIEALRRAAETVAYAHARGIVHRDLKPENLLLGEFGEVWVLDWGIAGPAGEAAAGAGSARYMAPEQAAGEPVGPAADVWALGALLYEILAGRPAYAGDSARARQRIRRGPPPALRLPVPPELARLVSRALAPRPAERFPDAGALAQALGAWLEGALAREEAAATLAEARALLAGVAARRERAATLRQAAAAALARVPSWAPAEAKAPAWRQEEEAAREEAEAMIEEEQAVELARAALQRHRELDEAHALLADHYRRRLEEAELTGNPAAPRLEARLRAHDVGAYAPWLEGTGAVTLVTDPPGARVTAFPLEERARRLVPGAPRDLGVTPLREVPLPRGSWLLLLEADGHEPVRYPVHLGRGEHWHGVPPGGSDPAPIPLPRRGALGAAEVYVPAGWFRFGGDERANNALPGERRWLDGFVIDRFLVTNTRWLAYANDLAARGQLEAAHAAIPRERASQPGEPGAPLYGFDGSRFFLKPDHDGDTWQPEWPVILITHPQALAYAAWRARADALPWRLPRGEEHEKAARGADGRIFPWGNGYDPSFACVAGAFPGRPAPAVVQAFPLDESVYGARGMAGNARTWCADRAEEGRYELRGSYWNASGSTGRCAARFIGIATSQTADMGVRLVRSFPQR